MARKKKSKNFFIIGETNYGDSIGVRFDSKEQALNFIKNEIENYVNCDGGDAEDYAYNFQLIEGESVHFNVFSETTITVS